jgi:hypothetical protein
MTVKELIEKLKEFPEDAEVVIPESTTWQCTSIVLAENVELLTNPDTDEKSVRIGD